MLWQGVCERQDNYYKKCDSSSVRVFDKTELCLTAAVWAQLCCLLFQVKVLNIALFFLLGKKLGYTFNNRNFHNVSLGQGQEVVAEQALDLAAKEGHWVILQVRCLWKHPAVLPGYLMLITLARAVCCSYVVGDGTRCHTCVQSSHLLAAISYFYWALSFWFSCSLSLL